MKHYRAIKPENLIPTGRIHKDKTGYGIATIYNLKERVNRYPSFRLRDIRKKQTVMAMVANGITSSNVKQF